LSWHSSSYYWKARASIVSFAESKSLKKYYKLLLKPMAVLIQREERFSKTAVGWALRNISKFDLEYVLSFLKSNAAYLSKEVIMNSLKYCDKNIKMEIVNLNRIELKNNS
jgi:3-methyladenine DNA glycosylase AlkD